VIFNSVSSTKNSELVKEANRAKMVFRRVPKIPAGLRPHAGVVKTGARACGTEWIESSTELIKDYLHLATRKHLRIQLLLTHLVIREVVAPLLLRGRMLI